MSVSKYIAGSMMGCTLLIAIVVTALRVNSVKTQVLEPDAEPGIASPERAHVTAQPPSLSSEPVSTRTIYYPFSGLDDSSNYYSYKAKLLALIFLSAPKECEGLELKEKPEYLSGERIHLLLETQRGMDVMWASGSRQRALRFKEISVDIVKGFKGYRTLLVKRDRIEEFKKIKTLNELRKKSVGSGDYWTDTEILRANHFDLVAFPSYTAMLPMLQRGRFDFASRGIDQTGDEMRRFEHLDVAWVPNILIYYPMANYFYVRKDDHRLAACLEVGFNVILNNGAFDELFQSIDSFRYAQTLLNKPNLILELENPF